MSTPLEKLIHGLGNSITNEEDCTDLGKKLGLKGSAIDKAINTRRTQGDHFPNIKNLKCVVLGLCVYWAQYYSLIKQLPNYKSESLPLSGFYFRSIHVIGRTSHTKEKGG